MLRGLDSFSNYNRNVRYDVFIRTETSKVGTHARRTLSAVALLYPYQYPKRSYYKITPAFERCVKFNIIDRVGFIYVLFKLMAVDC